MPLGAGPCPVTRPLGLGGSPWPSLAGRLVALLAQVGFGAGFVSLVLLLSLSAPLWFPLAGAGPSLGPFPSSSCRVQLQTGQGKVQSCPGKVMEGPSELPLRRGHRHLQLLWAAPTSGALSQPSGGGPGGLICLKSPSRSWSGLKRVLQGLPPQHRPFAEGRTENSCSLWWFSRQLQPCRFPGPCPGELCGFGALRPRCPLPGWGQQPEEGRGCRA